MFRHALLSAVPRQIWDSAVIGSAAWENFSINSNIWPLWIKCFFFELLNQRIAKKSHFFHHWYGFFWFLHIMSAVYNLISYFVYLVWHSVAAFSFRHIFDYGLSRRVSFSNLNTYNNVRHFLCHCFLFLPALQTRVFFLFSLWLIYIISFFFCF